MEVYEENGTVWISGSESGGFLEDILVELIQLCEFHELKIAIDTTEEVFALNVMRIHYIECKANERLKSLSETEELRKCIKNFEEIISQKKGERVNADRKS